MKIQSKFHLMRVEKLMIKNPAIICFYFILIFQVVSCSSNSNSNSNSNIQEISKKNSQSNNFDANVRRFEELWKNRYEKYLAELNEQEKIWKDQQIYNYSFVIEKTAGGVSSEWNRLAVLIKVRNAEKQTLEKVLSDDKLLYARTDGFEEFDTIDKLFNYLKQELENGRVVSGKYNKKLGYPEDSSITFSNNLHGLRSIIISEFQIED